MPASEATRAALHAGAGEERDAALAAALDGVIPRYTQALRHAIAQEQGPERLTMPQLRLLKVVAAGGGTTLTTQLARRMDVTVPTMTSRIDSLVERGFVERRPDPANRRQIHLALTTEGRAHLERCQALIQARLRRLLAQLSGEQKERLMLALRDLEAALAAETGYGVDVEAETGNGDGGLEAQP